MCRELGGFCRGRLTPADPVGPRAVEIGWKWKGGRSAIAGSPEEGPLVDGGQSSRPPSGLLVQPIEGGRFRLIGSPVASLSEGLLLLALPLESSGLL
jgi:hypothetical protein